MKNICFTQVGFDFDGSVYLPSAAGDIIACCMGDSEIMSEYNFTDIIFRREKLADAMKKINDPYIAAFSCSVWNMEYNKALARLVRKKYPGCTIIFGGHNVNENAELLESEDYIDILMFGEGELTFCELLRLLPQRRLGEVPNIAYRENGKTVVTDRRIISDLSVLPSPYLTGVFDGILENNPDTDFLAVLETNRGCPYSCAYCDWCAGRKLRFFPLEKVLREIEWLALHKIEYCFCADSNFGMFERDVQIAHALVESKRTTGYPKIFRPCYEKNCEDRVFEICSILNSEGMDKGATLAYQTLSDSALHNIGRKNLTLEHFSSLLKRYNEAGVPTYSELILGLPGETKQSFCEGLCRLLENGQHNSINVYHCEMLPNSDLSQPDYVKKHGIEIMRVPFNHIHSAKKRDEEIQEYSYLVRATNTLNRADWVYANLFSVLVQCFHSLGLLRCFSMYLVNEKRTSYLEFFTQLLDYIFTSSTRLNALFTDFKTKYENSLTGDWNYHDEKFGNVTWFFEEGAFLEQVCNFDSYFDELKPFLLRYNIETELFEQILLYQKNILRTPLSCEKTVTLDYDFFDYYEKITECKPAVLKKEKTVIQIKPLAVYTDIQDFARETVWYGRRRGATVFKGRELTKEPPPNA